MSTADCERGFAVLKRIKTAPRNRFKTQTLDMLIRISSEGPELNDFDFEHAATVWASKRNRYNVSSSSSLYNYVTVNFPCLLNWNAHGSLATPPWVWLGWWVWFSTLFDFYSGGNTAV